MDGMIIKRERDEFNKTLFRRGGFVRAKHFSWDAPRNGLVAYASAAYIKVLFLTGADTAASYFNLRVEEVVLGQWQLTVSPDLDTIYREVWNGSSDSASPD